jgi:hypothetical protein
MNPEELYGPANATFVADIDMRMNSLVTGQNYQNPGAKKFMFKLVSGMFSKLYPVEFMKYNIQSTATAQRISISMKKRGKETFEPVSSFLFATTPVAGNDQKPITRHIGLVAVKRTRVPGWDAMRKMTFAGQTKRNVAVGDKRIWEVLDETVPNNLSKSDYLVSQYRLFFSRWQARWNNPEQTGITELRVS